MLSRRAFQPRVYVVPLMWLLMTVSPFTLASRQSYAQAAVGSPAGPTVPAIEASPTPVEVELTADLASISIPPLAVEPVRAAITINGRPYMRPTAKQQFVAYLRDSYGLPALGSAAASSSYAQALDKPKSWGQDWTGFGQRFGTAAAVTAIDGNVRYGLEMLFHEDMRYIPCHGCTRKRKLENALLAEVTARHDTDGHRFFTLTPTISDMTGPILANAYWLPGKSAMDGFLGSRLVFATRIGGHLFTEFVLERRHYDPPLTR